MNWLDTANALGWWGLVDVCLFWFANLYKRDAFITWKVKLFFILYDPIDNFGVQIRHFYIAKKCKSCYLLVQDEEEK